VVILKLSQDINFDPLTLQLIHFFFPIKNTFLIQNFISFIFSPNLRLERESHSRERKYLSTPILTIKIVDISINEFHSMRIILLGCNVTLKFLEIVDLISKTFWILG
jgi:hypothetical protein